MNDLKNLLRGNEPHALEHVLTHIGEEEAHQRQE